MYDIISNPPPQAQRYTKLKAELIRRLSLTEEQRVRQLLSSEELGDRKPSQFLRHLRSLAGASPINENILRTLWLQRLPSNVQQILKVKPNLSLDDTADIADSIMQVNPPTPSFAVHAATAPPALRTTAQSAPAPPVPDGGQFVQRIEELIRMVAALHPRRDSTPKPRTRERSCSRYSRDSANRDASRDRICWYHRRFGTDARKCDEPCSMAPKNASGSH